VFEKRLILKYIEENGKEPGTDDELHPDDLLEIQSSRVVRPRPPNFTSLPSLLKAFQDEWDALVLESYNTKEQLARTREELATALYQHDAAVRVIARLTKERDEARDALSKVTIAPTGGVGASGDDMAIDSVGLPGALVAHVEEIQAQCVRSFFPLQTITLTASLDYRVFAKARARRRAHHRAGPPRMTLLLWFRLPGPT